MLMRLVGVDMDAEDGDGMVQLSEANKSPTTGRSLNFLLRSSHRERTSMRSEALCDIKDFGIIHARTRRSTQWLNAHTSGELPVFVEDGFDRTSLQFD